MEVIRSLNNMKIKNWCKLHEKKHREREQLFLVENEHLILEAIDANLLDTLILLEENHPYFSYDGMIYYVSEDVMKKLKMNQSLPTCMGVVRMPKPKMELGNKVILCDDIQDPGNIGTMIRSAYSFGFDSFIVSNKSVDVYNDKAIRATQGALFHMNVIRGDLVDFVHKLKKEDYCVYATSLHDAKGLSEFKNTEKIALIFGNEGSGVSLKMLEMSDENIFIEMSRFESLNVAMACGICCYWFRK